MLFVTYDLREPDRDYESLYKVLKTAKSWAKVTESSWMLAGEFDAEGWRDKLKSVMDGNDRLFVCVAKLPSAWINVICTNTWLNDDNNWA